MNWASTFRVVGYSGDCVGLYFAFLVVWTILKHDRPRHAIRWMSWIAKWNKYRRVASSAIFAYTPVLFALCVAGALTVGAARSAHRSLYDVYVISYDTDFHYHLRTGSTDFWTTFCPDYEPQFSSRQTLKVLTYEDMGKCWSIANTHPAYLILRDTYGQPILR